MVAVVVSHTGQHVFAAGLAFLSPYVVADFHVSYALLGGVLSLAGVLAGVLQGAAILVRRVSARALLVGQNTSLALLTALAAASPTFAVFALARVLGGLGSWPQHPVGSAYLTDRFPDRRATVLAWHTTGGNAGTVLAPLLGGAVLAAGSWRWAMASYAAVLALAAMGVALVGRRHPAPRPQPAAAPAAPAAGLRQALLTRPVLAVLVGGTISAAGRGAGVLGVYVPGYLKSGLHQPPVIVGLVAAAVSLGALFGPLLAGRLSDRHGHLEVLLALYGAGALVLAGFVLVGSNPAVLAAVAVAMGVFTYSEQPLRQTLYSDHMGGVSARAAFGAYFAISQSIGSLWVAIVGVVVTAYGFRWGFWVMAASFVAAALVIGLGTTLGRPRQATNADRQATSADRSAKRRG